MADEGCILCGKPTSDEQDCTTLACLGGETNSHTTMIHETCWETFKNHFMRGRVGNRSAAVFFCPVAGCHLSLIHI